MHRMQVGWLAAFTAMAVGLFTVCGTAAVIGLEPEPSPPPPSSPPPSSSPPSSTTAVEAVGRTRGYAGVSPSGEATYSIPLALPPGTHGLVPPLSLEYRHRHRDGTLGTGWTVGGLSAIVRCPRSLVQDGSVGTVGLTQADRFCLDGLRLVVVNGQPYGAPGAEYRTELEPFARIRSFGSAGAGPQYFVIEAADGRLLEYGATADSRIDWAGRSATPRAWALNRVRDRSGNVIDYSYAEDATNGNYRITRIAYNANPAAGITASHAAVFSYATRPAGDVELRYLAAAAIREPVRLTRVDVLYRTEVIRRYDLAYGPPAPATGRSRLTSVQECGRGARSCLSPTQFTWQDGTAGLGQEEVYSLPLGTARVDEAKRWWAGDINGDGREDVVWAGGSLATPSLHFRLAGAGGALGPDRDTGIPAPRGAGVPFDYDGDGTRDALLVSAAGRWMVVLGGPDGLVRQVDTGIVANGIDFRGADLDGNGLGDLAYSTTWGNGNNGLVVRAHYNIPGKGLALAATLLYDQPSQAGYPVAEGGEFLGRPGQRIDLDRDGREDLLMNENYSIARIAADARLSEPFQGGAAVAVPADVNGDGCTDLVYPHDEGRWHVRFSGCMVDGPYGVDVAGPNYQAARLVATALDWDGDGWDDVVFSNDATRWQLLVSVGVGLQAVLDTGLPRAAPVDVAIADLDGDGLPDLVSRAGAQIAVRRHAGAAPDLLARVTDGFGVSARFSYAALTDPAVYTKGHDAAYPLRDVQDGRQVVVQLEGSDGSGGDGLAKSGYRYAGLLTDPTGRGDLGFARRVTTQREPAGLVVTEDYRREFPFTGLVTGVRIERTDGALVLESTGEWRSLTTGSGSTARHHPYLATGRETRYEPGRAAYLTRTLRVDAIDTLSGLTTDVSVTTVEGDTGANPGASRFERIRHTSVLNDSYAWCLGRPLATEYTASHTLADGAALTEATAFDWDAATCRPTRWRVAPDDPKWQVAVDLGYDTFGNVVRQSVTGVGMTSRTSSWTFGSDGRFPQRAANPMGQAFAAEWEPGIGALVGLTDPNGLATRWEFDDFGRLLAETRPNGSRETWTRSACSTGCDARARYRLQQAEAGADGATGRVGTAEYDRFDRLVRSLRRLPGGGTSTSAVGFDALGRLVREELPAWAGSGGSGFREYRYDELGRLVRDSLYGPAGTLERATAYAHDGLALTQSGPRGNSSVFTQAAWGGTVAVRDALGGLTRYGYDAFGRLRQVQDPLGKVLATIAYNPRGMKVAQQDADLGTWTFERNALGELLVQRDAKGQSSRFEYDLLGRLVRRTEAEGVTTLAWGASPAARNVGRLASVTGPGYSETYAYDTVSRLATRNIYADAGYRYDYRYDSLGRLAALTYPASVGGFRLQLGYDYAEGELARIRDLSAMGATLWELGAVDPRGEVLDETLGGRLRVISGYDPVTALLDYRQSGIGGGADVQDLAYRWDPAGNLLERRDLGHGLSERFAYDAADQLQSATTGSGPGLELRYDAAGNVTWRSDTCASSAPCFAYDAAHAHAAVAAGTMRYAYDANGNMSLRGGVPLSWYSYNLPKSIGAGADQSQFWYGPARNRWRQAASRAGAWETTIYAGDLLEKVVGSSKTTWRHYIEAPTGTIAVQLRDADGSPPRTLLLTHDHLGSTDRIVDAASGAVVLATGFDALGRRRTADGGGAPGPADLAAIGRATHRGFAAHEALDNLGLVHMNARVYDPVLGRFLSPDPRVHEPFDFRDLNRYAYAWNNPLSVVDPSGLEEIQCLLGPDGRCPTITVLGLREWRDFAGVTWHFGGEGQVASAAQRDPCGQDGSAAACAGAAGRAAHEPQSAGTADYVRGFLARLGNIAMNSAPAFWLFDAPSDFEWFPVPDSAPGHRGALLGEAGYLLGGVAGAVRPAAAGVARRALASTSGVVRRFELSADQVFYRAFSGDATVGSWLTSVRPRSQAWAQEALSLPPWNGATHVQEVLVPRGTLMERSRASSVPEWGRLRGGAEQFKLLETIPEASFGPGSPLP